jgi:hypothetical protein
LPTGKGSIVSDQDRNIVVTDIKISFGRLVVVFVKLGLAAIPAAIILAIILGLLAMALGAILAGFGLVPDIMGGRPI